MDLGMVERHRLGLLGEGKGGRDAATEEGVLGSGKFQKGKFIGKVACNVWSQLALSNNCSSTQQEQVQKRRESPHP